VVGTPTVGARPNVRAAGAKPTELFTNGVPTGTDVAPNVENEFTRVAGATPVETIREDNSRAVAGIALVDTTCDCKVKSPASADATPAGDTQLPKASTVWADAEWLTEASTPTTTMTILQTHS
jgi:hypothetical protein